MIIGVGVGVPFKSRNTADKTVFHDPFDGEGALGEPWTPLEGTFAKTVGYAYSPDTAGNPKSVVDFGISDGICTVKIGTTRGNQRIYFRAVDNANHFQLWIGSNYRIYRFLAGAASQIASGGVPAANDVIKITLAADKINVLVNDVALFSNLSNTDHLTATKWGIGVESASASTVTNSRFEYFRLERP